jgi:hypothetical protein
MKAYFTTSIRNLGNMQENIDHIFRTIESFGHSIDKFNYSKNPNLDAESDSEITGAYKHITTSIKNSDFVIAEMTENSAAVGYEIAFAIGEKKPVLVLVNEEKRKELSTPFRGNKTKYLSVRKYKSKSDIENALKIFLSDVKNLIDTKFILIIPPSIDQYLEWNARERGIAKAEVTREAIENMMNSDEKYQQYLKQQDN